MMLCSIFPWIFLTKLLSHPFLLGITCTSITGGIMNKSQLQWRIIITRVAN